MKECRKIEGKSLTVSKTEGRTEWGGIWIRTNLSQQVSNATEHQKNMGIYF